MVVHSLRVGEVHFEGEPEMHWALERRPLRHVLAVAIVMAITTFKAGLILWNFMDLRSAPRGIGLYLISWVTVCAVLIGTLYCMGG